MPPDVVIEIDAVGLITLVITVIIFLNIVLAIVTLFRERREPASLWAWILVMFFLPVLGFLLWIFVGRRLTQQKIFEKLQGSSTDYGELALEQQRAIAAGSFAFANPASEHHRGVVELLMADQGALLTEDNRVQVFSDGRLKFDALINDIADGGEQQAAEAGVGKHQLGDQAAGDEGGNGQRQARELRQHGIAEDIADRVALLTPRPRL